VKKTALILVSVLLAACGKPSPLTLEKAEQIVAADRFATEPVYAEVPQKVWWSPEAPQDDYDRLALTTLDNLERAGLIKVTKSVSGDRQVVQGTVTPKGFSILGTMPSARGPAFRATIARKKYDGLQNFQRHPTDPTVGRADLVWHYEQPTSLYPLFETKIDKPLNKPFRTIVVFYWKDHSWRSDILVKKE
jgi:hypothetical protein